MDACYNCMYKFGSNEELERRMLSRQNTAPLKTHNNDQAGGDDRSCVSASCTDKACINAASTNPTRVKMEAAATSDVDISESYESFSASNAGNAGETLFAEFIVEFERFLSSFVADRIIGIK